MFDYEPGQRVQARVFGGWKQVTVEAVCGSSARVIYEHGANKRAVTIYDHRLIKPCPQPKNSPSTCPDQQSLDL